MLLFANILLVPSEIRKQNSERGSKLLTEQLSKLLRQNSKESSGVEGLDFEIEEILKLR